MPDHRVFVGVGSNIDAEHNIPEALRRLGARVSLTAVSTFYRTAPLARPEQPSFLNGVVRVQTPLTARALKSDVLLSIEGDLGRVRSEDSHAARCIDFDILIFNDAVVHEAGMRIPDPDIRERAFVAVPLLELAPDLVLPDDGEPLARVVQRMGATRLTPAEDFTARLKEGLKL